MAQIIEFASRRAAKMDRGARDEDAPLTREELLDLFSTELRAEIQRRRITQTRDA